MLLLSSLIQHNWETKLVEVNSKCRLDNHRTTFTLESGLRFLIFEDWINSTNPEVLIRISDINYALSNQARGN